MELCLCWSVHVQNMHTFYFSKTYTYIQDAVNNIHKPLQK